MNSSLTERRATGWRLGWSNGAVELLPAGAAGGSAGTIRAMSSVGRDPSVSAAQGEGSAGTVPAPGPGIRILAAADAGSNSVHLLVARLAGSDLEPVVDESVFLALGQAVDRGWLGPELRAELVGTLVEQVATARSLGAEAIALVGTEPLRRSADAARVVAEVERSTGAPLAVLTPTEEGLLTVLGVTRGRPVRETTVVVDVGGGSSQLVEVEPGGRTSCVGLPVGSARLTATIVRHDPPVRREWAELRQRASELVASTPRAEPKRLVFVGGTATNLGRLVPDGIAAEDAGRTLTPALVEAAAAVLLASPAAVVAERFALRPERARVLLAGAAILLAVFGHSGIPEAEISGASLREGLVLAWARVGRGWRDRLPDLVWGR